MGLEGSWFGWKDSFKKEWHTTATFLAAYLHAREHEFFKKGRNLEEKRE